MIAFNRTAGIVPGKTAEMLAFAREIAAHMKRQYDVELEVMMPVGGNPQRIAWTTRYPNLAALEAVNEKIMGDRAYWEMIAKASGCFVAGSVRDSIWRTV